MPKIKTNRGAAKRFKRSGKGKLLRHRAYTRHILSTKPRKRKRNLRQGTVVAACDSARMNHLVPYL